MARDGLLAACKTLAFGGLDFAPRYRTSAIFSQASILAVRSSSTVLHACDSVPSALHHRPFAHEGRLSSFYIRAPTNGASHQGVGNLEEL